MEAAGVDAAAAEEERLRRQGKVGSYWALAGRLSRAFEPRVRIGR
jgi:hypothetical protein